MTEREALIQLATPEPDYADHPVEWQEWRDRVTEALRLAQALEGEGTA